MVMLKNYAEDHQQRNLLVYDFGTVGKNGMHKLQIQLDARDDVAKDGAGLKPDKVASLRLVDRETHYKDRNDGTIKSTYEHGAFYTEGQYEKIKEAAGAKTTSVTLSNGNKVEIFGVKADLIRSSETFRNKKLEPYKAGVLAINTLKEMGPSDFTVGPKVYDNQFKRSQEIRKAVVAAYEALQAETPAKEKETPAVEAESKAKDVEMDAPEM